MDSKTNSKKYKSKDLHPLSLNIIKRKRFNYFNVDYSEILFFEWLIVYSSRYGFKEFYRSNANIYKDIGLKRAKIERARNKFKKLGFLKTEVKGVPAVQHYLIEFDILLNCLDNIYKNEFIDEMRECFVDFYNIKKTNGEKQNLKKETVPLELLKFKYLKNKDLTQIVCETRRIGPKTLSRYLNKFIIHLKTRNELIYKEQDFIKHFINWLAIQLADRRPYNRESYLE